MEIVHSTSGINAETQVGTKARQGIWRVVIYVFLTALAVISLFPFYIMLIDATHSNSDIVTALQLLPGSSLIRNYQSMQQQVNIWRGYLNSAVISSCATALTCYFGGLTAYGFSKFKFRFNKQLFGVVIATLMVPPQLSLIGFYQWMHQLGMLNTYWPLIIPAIANAYATFFFRQFIDSSVPDEVMEAARIDGASEIGIFNRIVFPMIMPAISSMAIFAFIGSWNNFLLPLIILFSPNMFTLPILVVMAKGIYSTDYGVMYLGVAMSVVPIIIGFSIASRKIIGGITLGAVKG